jgi:hypothetical protein
MYEGYWIEGLKTLYVDLPKTASRAMLKVIGDHYGGARRWWGELPEDLEFAYTVVRNPYARALSIWWSACFVEGDRYGFNQWAESPTVMVNALAAGARKRTDLAYTQVELLTSRKCRTPQIVHYERLEEEFFKIDPFKDEAPFEFPVVNRKVTGRPVAHYTREFIEAVNNWCPTDFQLGGYCMLHPGNEGE